MSCVGTTFGIYRSTEDVSEEESQTSYASVGLQTLGDFNISPTKGMLAASPLFCIDAPLLFPLCLPTNVLIIPRNTDPNHNPSIGGTWTRAIVAIWASWSRSWGRLGSQLELLLTVLVSVHGRWVQVGNKESIGRRQGGLGLGL